MVGIRTYNAGGNGIRMLVRLVYRENDSQWFSLSYRFFAPGRSCRVKPDTNMSRRVRKNGPSILAYRALYAPPLTYPYAAGATAIMKMAENVRWKIYLKVDECLQNCIMISPK